MKQKISRVEKAERTRPTKVPQNRFVAVAEFALGVLIRAKFVSGGSQTIKKLVSRALNKATCQQSGFVAVVIQAQDHLADVIDANHEEVQIALVDCLAKALGELKSSGVAHVGWRNLWIDVHLKKDFSSARRHGIEISREFGDAELGPRTVGKGAPISRPVGAVQHKSTVVGGARFDVIRELHHDAVKEDRDSYDAVRKRATALVDDARKEAARVLQPAINDRAAEMPHEKYEDKKRLAKWVNAELRRMGLAIRCPRTGIPCYLMGNPGGQPGFGRFLLEYTDEEGKRRHPLTSVTLPHLDLMPDDLSRASYTKSRSR